MVHRSLSIAALLALLSGLLLYQYPWILDNIGVRVSSISTNPWTASLQPPSATTGCISKPVASSQETTVPIVDFDLDSEDALKVDDPAQVPLEQSASTNAESAGPYDVGSDESSDSPPKRRLRGLPAPGENDQMDASLADGSVQLEKLGPIVVNNDG
ncbi:hypothetical protein FRC02_007076 [Tulasnella sp. 418]|nr:hypothetical protein FRC02_007076 [Tulasnella sp. 418]